MPRKKRLRVVPVPVLPNAIHTFKRPLMPGRSLYQSVAHDPPGIGKLSDLLRKRKLVTSVEYGGRNPNILILPCASRALVTNVENGGRDPNILILPCASRRVRATGRARASLHITRTACTVYPHAAARDHAA